MAVNGSKQKETMASTTPKSKKEEPSLFNIIMLYLTLIGLGVIIGYSAFYYQFSERCVVLLQKAEDRFNSSKIEWQTKHQEAIAEKESCLDPLHQLQGKLEAQSAFGEKYQALLEKHEEALSKLETLQQSKQESSDIEAQLNAQIGKLKLDVERAMQKLTNVVKEKESMRQDLQTRLTSTMEKLAEKTIEVKNSQKNQEGCASQIPLLESNLQTVQSFVQNRSERMCRMEYGRGPFMIQFNVRFPDEEETEPFQVQLASLSEMPHTIFVFMELIALKAYHGTVIKAGERTLDAGNPADTETSVAVKLLDRLVKYGYEKPVAFREHSETFPHDEYTIGFVEAGPALAINIGDNSKERGPEGRDDPCFGKVISGFETLARIQEAEGSPIELVSIERVR